jgi:hypothetical protein
MEREFKINDRVTVNDGPGFTLGRGTVMAFYPATDSKHIDLVEVALDDEDRKVLVAVKDVTRIND